MNQRTYDLISDICAKCGGRCCYFARPPLSEERISILLENGITWDKIKFGNYRNLDIKSTGFCSAYHEGRCKVQSVKPETCVAGPFTFDIKDGNLEIYLKKERICDLVSFIKEHSEVYKEQYELAIKNIMHLIKNLPEDELREILKVDEPETMRISEIPLTEVYADDGRN